jgi:hypothetical protein
MHVEKNMNMDMGVQYTFSVNGKEIGTSKNLLTNGWWDRFFAYNGTAQVGLYGRLYLGTGTTTPAVTDVGMEAHAVTSGQVQASATSVSVTTVNGKYYGIEGWQFLFLAGTFSGQAITEVGMRMYGTGASDTNNPAVIDSHALIRDALGNLVVLNLGATDSLVVDARFYYRIPDMASTKGQYTTISGNVYELSWGAINQRNTSVDQWAIPFFHPLFRENSFSATNTKTQAIYESISNDCCFLDIPENLGIGVDSDEHFVGVTGTDYAPDENYSPSRNETTPCRQTNISIDSVNRTITARYEVRLLAGNDTFARGCNDSSNNYYDWVLRSDPVMATGDNITTFLITFKFGNGETFSTESTDATLGAIANAGFTEQHPNGLATTTRKAYVSVFGGISPYTYSWAYVSGGSALLSADAPTSAITTFSGTGTSQTSTEVWRCTVTDANSSTTTVDVTVGIEWV